MSIPGGISRGAGRIPAVVRIIVVAVLTALVIGSGLLAYFEATTASNAQVAQQQQGAAAAAAKTEVAKIFTWSYKDQGTSVPQAIAATTGEFRGEWSVYMNQVVTPALTPNQIVNSVSVQSAVPLNSNGDGQVTVLVFFDENSVSKAQPKGRKTAAQARLTMQNVGGQWLIEAMKLE